MHNNGGDTAKQIPRIVQFADLPKNGEHLVVGLIISNSGYIWKDSPSENNDNDDNNINNNNQN